MSKKELSRLDVINRLIRRSITGSYASQLLKLSLRQIWRIRDTVHRKGPSGLIHGNKGKQSGNRISDNEHTKIVSLLHKHYHDFKPTFASEKLSEQHNITHSPKTIRHIMIDEGLWIPKKQKDPEDHRSWRQRRACYGEMLQFDGSYHHWFEDRGPELCLLLAIDDATSRVPYAFFDHNEGVFSVFSFWEQYITAHGKPFSIYLDKFSTYKSTRPQSEENHDTKTQFQRAMAELGIEPIFAHSPQAKGRVERVFNTLQDRLVKELRLAGISTIEEANRFLADVFLPRFNKQFSVEPRSKENLHRSLTREERTTIGAIFSRQESRVIMNDFTLSFKKQWHQLDAKQPVLVRKRERVIVEERVDGSVHIRLRGKYLSYTIVPKRQEKRSVPWILSQQAPQSKRVYAKPAADHPWRRPFLPAREPAQMTSGSSNGSNAPHGAL